MAARRSTVQGTDVPHDALLTSYLDELDLPDLSTQPPSSTALVALHRAHAQRFANDTMWKTRRRVPRLDAEEIVGALLAGEGGGCTQLGFGFHWLLHRLGYNVRLHQARVQFTLDEDFRPWPQHPVLTIRVDATTWYADVAMGNGMLDPIPLVEGPSLQPGGLTYWLERKGTDGVSWEFRQDPRMRGVSRLRFDASKDGSINDFQDGFQKIVAASGPQSNNTIGASRRDEGGVTVLSDDTVTRVDVSGRTRTRLDSAEEWESVLRDGFRLGLPGWSRQERDRLWQRVSARV